MYHRFSLNGSCMTACLSVCGVLAATASAQTPCPTPDNCVTNPSFEVRDTHSAAGDPLGWHDLSNPTESKRRVFNDGLSPTAPMGHTGTATVMLLSPGHSEFRGMTTDWQNCSATGCPYFFDPVFDWYGGDVVVTAWYYIPVGSPITGDSAFIKLNIKRGNQDYATYDSISEGTPDQVIQGDTNNQWRPYSIRWTRESIQAELDYNEFVGEYFVTPPYPDHLKIVLSRFGFNNVPSSGVIFWDDISYHQDPGASTCGCAADYNQDGGVDGGDVAAFFPDWENAQGCSDVNQDGGIDGQDVAAFFQVWEAGGC